MTRNLQRLLSAILALVMVFAMGSFTAYASGTTGSITITNSANDKVDHTYAIYQIFTGDLVTDAETKVKTLSNVKYGSAWADDLVGKDATTVAEALAEGTYGETDGDTILAALKAKNTEAADLTVMAGVTADKNNGYKFSDLPIGYYLVKDAAAVTGEGAATSYIIKVVGDVSVTAKSDVPSVEKKVDDKNDSTTDQDATTWEDSADYDIGDIVPFQITGTLPSNYADYNTYKYTFHDEQSAGLTFDASSLVVKADDIEVDPNCYTIKTTGLTDDCTFEIAFDDLKTIVSKAEDGAGSTAISLTATSKIVVTYNSTLNEAAVIGAAGNPNTVNLKFSNNPNSGGDGETGTTPDDTVIVFTYDVTVSKVDGDNKPLEGAEFSLYKWDAATNAWTVVKENLAATEVTETQDVEGVPTEVVVGYTYNYSGIDDGYYKLVESNTPGGYNTAEDKYFAVVAEHDTNNAAPTLTTLEVKSLTFNENDNTFTVGEADADFTINIANNNNEDLINTSIVNRSGSTLPETGGMGTKIFYTLGGILVIGAGILLITKRRMKNA